MSLEFSNCVDAMVTSGRPAFILSWTSGVIKLYPWFMRVSLVLHRLVQ